jgi:protein-S-isoprenylcysteine O-methyltransferase Ste14
MIRRPAAAASVGGASQKPRYHDGGMANHVSTAKLPPVATAIVAALAMWATRWLLPQAAVQVPGRVPVAVTLAALGGAVALAGVVALRRAGTTVNPLTPDAASAVVTGGAYRVSRNPMYLGLALGLGGWAVWLASPPALAWLVAFVAWIDRCQIAPEERALRAKFGRQFADYARSVRRWL